MSETLSQKIETISGLEHNKVEKLTGALRDELLQMTRVGESIALPTFGTFATVKEDEHVALDLVSGKNVMLPPHLEIKFTTGGALRNSLKNKLKK